MIVTMAFISVSGRNFSLILYKLWFIALFEQVFLLMMMFQHMNNFAYVKSARWADRVTTSGLLGTERDPGMLDFHY